MLARFSFKKEKVQFSFQTWEAKYSLGVAFLLKVEVVHEEFVVL